MRRTYVAVLVACLSVGAARAAEGARPLDPQRLAVMVSESGDVTSTTYITQAPPSIRTRVERAVRGWKFAPQVVDGNAVPWATFVDVGLVAEPVEDGYRLRVSSASTVNLEVVRYRSPDLPVSASRTLKNALVCADLSLGVDAATPTIEALWLDDTRVDSEDDPYWRSLRKALRRWRIQGVEIAGKRWPSGSVRVPIVASGNGGPELADLAYSMRCQARASTLGSGFRLVTPVLGTVLAGPLR
jgi:hypothetical protein